MEGYAARFLCASVVHTAAPSSMRRMLAAPAPAPAPNPTGPAAHLCGVHHLLQVTLPHGAPRRLQPLLLCLLNLVGQLLVRAQLHRHTVSVVQQVLADQGACKQQEVMGWDGVKYGSGGLQ